MLIAILLIISSVGVVFLDHFLISVLGVSVLIIIALHFWDKINAGIYLPYIIVISLILDVTNQLFLGTHLVCIGIVVGLAYIIKIVLPRDILSINIATLFVLTYIYYIILNLLSSLLLDSVLPFIDLSYLLRLLVPTLISSLIYLSLGVLTQSLRSNKMDKIRLR